QAVEKASGCALRCDGWASLSRGTGEVMPGRSLFVPFALAWCAAMLSVHQLPTLPGTAWLVPAAMLAFIALERPSRRWLFGAIVAAIWTVASADRKLDDRLPAELTGRDFDVVGWVD